MTPNKTNMTTNEKCKYLAIDIAENVAQIMETDKLKRGVLLCEGTSTSMDVFLYSAIYPELIVVPANGCTDVRKLMPFMRKYCEYNTYGLIDRDNCSKKQIRTMEKNEQVYSTKLPFIENILCCPEVLKIITKSRKKRYEEVITEVRERLMDLLAKKMSLMNPFNISLPEDRQIASIYICFYTKNDTFYKVVDVSNVMYTFRDKAIVSIVADAMDLRGGREEYYRFLKEQIYRPNGEKILQACAKYLPVIVERT